jgi:peptidoglycan hydrolase-like amidase
MQASVITETRPKTITTKQAAEPKAEDPQVKVKIAGFDTSFAEIKGTKITDLWYRDKKLASIAAGTPIEIRYVPDTKTVSIKSDTQNWKYIESFPGNISLKTDGILRIENYRNPRFGQGKVFYNSFRGALHLYPQSEKLLVVNELPIEEYLWGLGEEPSTEPTTKRHVIHILARSYAKVYSGTKRKFRTPLYDLEDDPRTSQLYLGYDWEQYHTEQKALIAETEGQVLVKDGETVIGPYFTQSSGQSVNPWASQYPWCRVRELPYDKGLAQRGHGVGLSGNTARILAEQGKSIQEIIDYFFEELVVKKMY